MRNKQKGFTLIELLIVVAIIGILAAVGAAVIPGLLGGAKVKATPANHKEITNFMMIKFTLLTFSLQPVNQFVQL